MARVATQQEKRECRRATNFIFAQFNNNFVRVAKACGVSEKTARGWYNKGVIGQMHVETILDTDEVNNQLKKKQVRPDISHWQ
jgi:hypothetical protein